MKTKLCLILILICSGTLWAAEPNDQAIQEEIARLEARLKELKDKWGIN